MQPLKSPFYQLDKNQVRWFYAITVLICSVIAYGLIKGYLFSVGLPFALILLLMTIFRLDLVVYLAVFVTPFSINLAKTSIGIGVSLPSEPIMFGLFLVFWLKILSEGGLDKRITNHPVTWMIFFHLLWYSITTATSSMPMVSFKSTLARFCYISVFYFMVLYLFSHYKNIKKFLWLYMIPLGIVCLLTMINQAGAGFTEKNAHIAMVPYYNDHTAYAAVIAFFIPLLIALIVNPEETKKARTNAILMFVLLVTAIVLSYTRAAWVALAGGLACYLVYVFRIKDWMVYTGIALVVITYALFHVQITMYLERNDKTSSTDFSAHVQSIGNISTDDSNIERLNRWSCALRMFKDKPLFGYGPGTYMFQYGRYQKYSERSGISTNFAEGGGSHSEYLGPLAEQGIFGPITFILIAAVVIQRSAKFLRRCNDKSTRGLVKGLLMGLVTYWIHGGLNYFLDTEKAAVPFWGFIAALVALEIYYDDHTAQKLSERSAA